MSLLPFLLNYDPWEYERRYRGFDWDHFGLGITPGEIQALMEFPRLRISQQAKPESQACTVGKDGFQACIDVKQFKPNEITVKTVDNNVVVEGKHEERQDDHGFISRHFVRKYALPKGYDPKEIVSTLSSDGVLTIKAPPPQEAIEAKERTVQIQMTGPAHLNVKENPAAVEEPPKESK